jgi:hypothetical protein
MFIQSTLWFTFYSCRSYRPRILLLYFYVCNYFIFYADRLILITRRCGEYLGTHACYLLYIFRVHDTS